MIESMVGVVKATAEASNRILGEQLTKPHTIELGPPRGVTELINLGVGGDFRSVLDALCLSPEALGLEVRAPEVASNSLEQVPLRNSKGEVAHLLSPQEAKHYETIGLTPREVNGHECLVRKDIDWSQRDAYGQTNQERAANGVPPLDARGRPLELHHVQQDPSGMLAELSFDEHRGGRSYGILHDSSKRSEVDHGREWSQTREAHWMERAAEVRAAGVV